MDETTSFDPIHLKALALLEYAESQDMEEVYQQIWLLVESKDVKAAHVESTALADILGLISVADLEAVLLDFLEIAQERMDAVRVEVISAMPLDEEQMHSIEVRLVKMMRKQLDISTTVDPSILGGVRILVDNTVIDYSIKRRLQDIKQAIAEGVYQSDD